jgi:hypothetical protein
MTYKLKNTDGKVTFLLRTGKDLVRNQMAIASAQHIIDNGKLKKSDQKGYPIYVDDRWYFEGEVYKKKASAKEEKA